MALQNDWRVRLREGITTNMSEQYERHHSLLSPEMFTWAVRKEFNWLGGYEYSIEILGLHQCISYGESYSEARKGLPEAIEIWQKYNKGQISTKQLPSISTRGHLVIIQPQMTKEEFDTINQRLQALS